MSLPSAFDWTADWLADNPDITISQDDRMAITAAAGRYGLWVAIDTTDDEREFVSIMDRHDECRGGLVRLGTVWHLYEMGGQTVAAGGLEEALEGLGRL